MLHASTSVIFAAAEDSPQAACYKLTIHSLRWRELKVVQDRFGSSRERNIFSCLGDTIEIY